MDQSATTAIRLAILPETAEAEDDPDLDPTIDQDTLTEAEGPHQETEDPEETAETDDDPDPDKRRDPTTEPREDLEATPPVCLCNG